MNNGNFGPFVDIVRASEALAKTWRIVLDFSLDNVSQSQIVDTRTRKAEVSGGRSLDHRLSRQVWGEGR